MSIGFLKKSLRAIMFSKSPPLFLIPDVYLPSKTGFILLKNACDFHAM